MELIKTKAETEPRKITQIDLVILNPSGCLNVEGTTNKGNEGQIEILYYKYPQIGKLTRNIIKQIAKLELPETEMDLQEMDVECICCGTCCRFFKHIPLKEDDMARLVEFLGITIKEFNEKYTTYANIIADWQADEMVLKKVPSEENGVSQCIFLQKADSGRYLCSVHPAKPDICRRYKAGAVHCRPRWKFKIQQITQINLAEFDFEVFLNSGSVQKISYDKALNVLKLVGELIKELKNIDLQKYDQELSDEHFQMPCLRCGHCCISGLCRTVTDSDIDRIAEFFHLSRQEVINRCLNFMPSWEDGFYYLKKVNDDPDRFRWCIFLERDKADSNLFRCSIYPARPQVCRDFKTGNADCFARMPWVIPWEEV